MLHFFFNIKDAFRVAPTIKPYRDCFSSDISWTCTKLKKTEETGFPTFLTLALINSQPFSMRSFATITTAWRRQATRAASCRSTFAVRFNSSVTPRHVNNTNPVQELQQRGLVAAMTRYT